MPADSKSSKSSRMFLLAVLFMMVFLAMGNQIEEPEVKEMKLNVTVGCTAVLPCDVSAMKCAKDAYEEPIIRLVIDGGQLLCSFDEGRSRPNYRQPTEITQDKNSKYLYHLLIKEAMFSDREIYACQCQLSAPGSGEVVTLYKLEIQGRVESRELSEGEDLSITLCRLSSSYIEFCGPAENSTADGACRIHEGRLTVRNGSVTLNHFTAKDEGVYRVRERMGGEVILTLTLKSKPKPAGPQDPGHGPIHHWVIPVCALLALLVSFVVAWLSWRYRRGRRNSGRSASVV